MNDGIIKGMQAHICYRDGLELKRFDADAATFDNALFHLSVDIADTISIKAVLQQPLQVQLFSLKFTIEKSGAVSYLNRHYKTEELRGTIHNNDFTPIHILFSHQAIHYAILGANKHYAHSIADKGDAFELTLYIDAAALHPQWSYSTQQRQPAVLPLLPAGHTYSISLQLLKSNTEMQLPILSRYPGGASAAFIITDHCDYDNTARLQNFLQSWLGKGLKMTKGVFTIASAKQAAKHAPILQDEAYRTLIQQLYNDGSEIAPHALAQSGQLSIDVFYDALLQIQQLFAPATWIDHGTYLKYCYTTGGATHPDYKLVEVLQAQGYTSLWAYHDTPVMPHQSLNIFSAIQPSLSGMFWHKLLQGKWQVAMHYLKTYLERNPTRSASLLQVFSALRMLRSKRSCSKFWRDIAKAFKPHTTSSTPYTADELLQASPALYTETAQPFYTYKAGLLLFASQEVVHTKDAYTPAMLDELIAANGLHIGHTYILNNQSYIDGIFSGSKLSAQWLAFVDYLSAQVQQGKVWNPAMKEFTAWNKALNALHITYTSSSISITNPTTNAITGLSFMIPGNRNFLEADIPANTTIELSW
jgi:hypothetical protein